MLTLSQVQLEHPQFLWGLLGILLLAILRERSTAGHSAWRSFGALILRSLTLAAVLLALARPWTEERRPDRSAVFVIDASASLDESRRATASTWLREADRARGEARARWVVAGAELTVHERLDDALAALATTAAPEAGTDLRSALERGLAALPPARHREVFLLSDGAATRGRVEDALRVAETRDLPIHTIPLGPAALRAGVVAVHATQDRMPGEEVAITAQLVANAPISGQLHLSVDGERVDSLRVDVGPGSAEASVDWVAEGPGLHAISVRLEVTGDPLDADDVAAARVRVKPLPAALVVGPPDGARALQDAVASYRPALRVEQRPALPDDLTPWSLVVVLDPDLPRWPASRSQMLVDWVRGGGRLLVTGGPNGLVTDEAGAEPLAAILPVRFPKTKKEEKAPLAVVYCLDTSDSMAGAAKFELAAAALGQSLAALPENARIGVVGFADRAEWVLPLAPSPGMRAVLQRLDQVQIQGGTSMFTALEAAYPALKADDSLVKHVVLLSDGQSTSSFDRNGGVVGAMLRNKITVSTIAVSRDSDRRELERIAEAGGGRAYYAERFTDLPQLFLEEMMQVTRTNKVEQEFAVQAVVGSRLLGKLGDAPSIPPLTGYVKGEQRAGTELALATDDGHPVLVGGRHGRGAVTLLTTDVGGPWSEAWRSWKEHRQLWDGVLEALLRPEPPDRLDLQAIVRGDQVELVFDALDPLRNPRGDLLVEAVLNGADGQRRLALPPVGPGRYGATVGIADGPTLIGVAAVGTLGTGPSAPGGELLASVMPQPAEEVLAGTFNPQALRRIAERTGGRFDPAPAECFAAERGLVIERIERWRWPLLVAFALLLLDLLWRRARWPLRR